MTTIEHDGVTIEVTQEQLDRWEHAERRRVEAIKAAEAEYSAATADRREAIDAAEEAEYARIKAEPLRYCANTQGRTIPVTGTCGDGRCPLATQPACFLPPSPPVRDLFPVVGVHRGAPRSAR